VCSISFETTTREGDHIVPRVISVASWNVEHFRGGDPDRVERVVNFIKGNEGGPPEVPDVFALYEVEGRDVYTTFMKAFPEHRFHLTEGKNTQEIFIGVHQKLQSFATQRLEFQTGRDALRPGLFLTVRAGDEDYCLLFLHIKSGDGPEDFGLRDAAFEHAFNLKKALDKATDKPANFLFMGDLNTMGIDDPVPWSTVMNVSSSNEIERLEDWCTKREMLLQSKSEQTTWWNGSDDPKYAPTDLDHVVASEHMDIRRPGAGEKSGVSVIGWQQLSDDAALKKWLVEYSDHNLLFFEVWKPDST
jgi:Endonuclease/Exonuclease/phosphatase family